MSYSAIGPLLILGAFVLVVLQGVWEREGPVTAIVAGAVIFGALGVIGWAWLRTLAWFRRVSESPLPDAPPWPAWNEAPVPKDRGASMVARGARWGAAWGRWRASRRR